MSDTIEKLEHSLIQHGKASDRVYLMKLDANEAPAVIEKIEEIAEANDYGKLFCKVPLPALTAFAQAGYKEEARVPKFFDGCTDAVFMSRFRKPSREHVSDDQRATITKALTIAEQKGQATPSALDCDYCIRRLNAEDTSQLAALYRVVFPSYPFPIFEEDYLRETMTTHIRYFGAFHRDRLVAAASAEADLTARNAEMTDFATEPQHRRRQLAGHLLCEMEEDMKTAGFATLYTIARAASIGINATFAKCGYTFAGTLINNTQISGRIESMNVWYKNLPEHT